MAGSEWAMLRDYSSLIEANFDRAFLEQEGFPVLVKGPVTGIFGPGFAGPTAEGVRLFVSEERLEDAMELLAGADEKKQ